MKKKALNVLMLVCNPFTNDPRVYNEARSLTQAGHKVTVIAFDKDKLNPQSETRDGISIFRISPKVPQRYYLGTPPWNGFSPLSWQRQAYSQALLLHKEHHFSIIHCHDFDTLLTGVRLKRQLSRPLIYDAHEIYGYMMARHFPRRIANIFLWLEKNMIPNVDRIITVSEIVEKYFNRITNKSIAVIMNCKPLQNLEYERPDNRGIFCILYIGVLNEARSLSLLIDVVEKLDGVRCIIGGIGQPDYVRRLKERCDKVPNIDFIGEVPLAQVIPITKKADIIFCMFDPTDPNSAIGLPNKQFEAMVCGRPIICTKGTYSGSFTEKEDVGLAVEYSRKALREAIVQLRDDSKLRETLGKNALKVATTKYNWQNQETKLLELYENIDVVV